jgi:hypothetical protein
MGVIKDFCSNIPIKCCRFHLPPAWWWKIKKIGLSSEYKHPESKAGIG